MMVRLENVGLTIGGDVLLSDVTAGIAAGGISVIMGPNGAGKSTLVRLLHGLVAPSRGRIVWSRADMAAGAAQAMVFQRPVILRRSVRANLDHALAPLALCRRERARRIAEALKLAGLAGQAGQAARTLSVGEQQRLAFARALARRPRVLFLDEPCANLDMAASAAIEGLIRQADAAGTKIVLVTHDQAQARRIGDDIVFLAGGRVWEQARAADFFQRARTAPARAYLEGRLEMEDCAT